MGGGGSLRRRLGAAFLVGAGLLALAGIVGGLALRAQTRAVDLQVDRLDPANRMSRDLLASLVDQETGVRGFVLTGQDSFLDPYRDGQARADATVAGLSRLLTSSPRLRDDLRVVVERTESWRAEAAEPAIAASRAELGTLATVEDGKARFDAVRQAMAGFIGAIADEREAARQRLRLATSTLLGTATATLISVAAAGLAAWVVARRWVLTPLGNLGHEVQVVAAGRLDHRLAVSGPSEITDLASDVEAMRRRLLANLDEAAVQTEELKRSNTELEQFAYVASHDLQEPLRKVASFCQMLERRYKGQLDERADQYIGFAVDGAKRMQVLINDLLAFSRVGRLSAGLVPVDLNGAVRQALANLAVAIDETGAEVTFDELPVVDGDGSLLAQLLQNLVGNAVKFARPGVPPQIEVTVGSTEDGWEFACRDNGIGIGADYAERVFVIFQRLHSKEAYPGTGIGLALCRKIVEFHGGRIWVDSSDEAEPGTTIRWTLPTRRPTDEETQPDGP